MCVRAFSRRVEPTLRRKKLGLRLASRELTIGQHQRRRGDLARSPGRVPVRSRAGRRPQGAPRLLERPLGVLGVLTSIELGEAMLELCDLGVRPSLIGDTGSSLKNARKPEQNQNRANGARPAVLTETRSEARNRRCDRCRLLRCASIRHVDLRTRFHSCCPSLS